MLWVNTSGFINMWRKQSNDDPNCRLRIFDWLHWPDVWSDGIHVYTMSLFTDPFGKSFCYISIQGRCGSRKGYTYKDDVELCEQAFTFLDFLWTVSLNIRYYSMIYSVMRNKLSKIYKNNIQKSQKKQKSNQINTEDVVIIIWRLKKILTERFKKIEPIFSLLVMKI